MQADLNLNALRLTGRALHTLMDARGTLVSCLSGTLWLTQQDDGRDIVLEAGDDALIERDGLSVIAALGSGSFVLSRLPPLPKPAPKAPALPLFLRAMN